jgi:acetyl-CoA C-acetyltransferase
MHALTAMQLCGAAGDMQVKDAKLGGIFNFTRAQPRLHWASTDRGRKEPAGKARP